MIKFKPQIETLESKFLCAGTIPAVTVDNTALDGSTIPAPQTGEITSPPMPSIGSPPPQPAPVEDSTNG